MVTAAQRGHLSDLASRQTPGSVPAEERRLRSGQGGASSDRVGDRCAVVLVVRHSPEAWEAGLPEGIDRCGLWS
jgi:hypothetical protein